MAHLRDKWTILAFASGESSFLGHLRSRQDSLSVHGFGGIFRVFWGDFGSESKVRSGSNRGQIIDFQLIFSEGFGFEF